MKEVTVSVAELAMDSAATETCLELGVMVLRVWAHILTAKTRWPLVIVMGKSLILYADIILAESLELEPRHLQQAG
jgi:hypothetical protein